MGKNICIKGNTTLLFNVLLWVFEMVLLLLWLVKVKIQSGKVIKASQSTSRGELKQILKINKYPAWQNSDTLIFTAVSQQLYAAERHKWIFKFLKSSRWIQICYYSCTVDVLIENALFLLSNVSQRVSSQTEPFLCLV